MLQKGAITPSMESQIYISWRKRTRIPSFHFYISLIYQKYRVLEPRYADLISYSTCIMVEALKKYRESADTKDSLLAKVVFGWDVNRRQTNSFSFSKTIACYSGRTSPTWWSILIHFQDIFQTIHIMNDIFKWSVVFVANSAVTKTTSPVPSGLLLLTVMTMMMMMVMMTSRTTAFLLLFFFSWRPVVLFVVDTDHSPKQLSITSHDIISHLHSVEIIHSQNATEPVLIP